MLEQIALIDKEKPDYIQLSSGSFENPEVKIFRAPEGGACDTVGLGRSAVKFPDLPKKIVFNEALCDDEVRFDLEPVPTVPSWITNRIRPVGAGAETANSVLGGQRKV
ncbi:hypothetical protein N0V88_004506 [Collariella sp. IMI 366227]|nr:hypothetical protein N0V88_004506 [Collariella sp. IMI 366227]